MRVLLGGVQFRGTAIDLGERIDPKADDSTVVAELDRAVRRPTAVATTVLDGAARPLRIDCAAPNAVHDHVGAITSTVTLDVQTALADAARSRGATAPNRERLQQLRAELADIEMHAESTDAARRDVASAGADERQLRESVAELRGRVQTLRETAPDSRRLDETEAELAEAVRNLSEAETDRMAAEQRLARAERAARRARDTRERRLRLRDRLENREREARAALAERATPAFRDAVEATPEPDRSGPTIETPAAPIPPTTAALAIARIADIDAPIVIADGRFDDASAAAIWVDAPVVRVDIQTE